MLLPHMASGTKDHCVRGKGALRLRFRGFLRMAAEGVSVRDGDSEGNGSMLWEGGGA